jgi:hypothetical protein
MPKNESVQDRLTWCLKHGRLTVADLTLWFERSYWTVRNWIDGGVEPRGPRTGKMLDELAALERMIKRRRKPFPVPFSVDHFKRPAYIRKARSERHAYLPKRRSA